jgi:glycerol uptake facilitator-like aquaporin
VAASLTPKIVAAEAVGTLAYCCANVGSGIMAERKLVDDGLVLLAISLGTGVTLAVLTAMLEPVGDAWFNPAQAIADAVERKCSLQKLAVVVVVQVLAAFCGMWIAHAMFSLPLLELSAKPRHELGQVLGELVATAGLLTVSGGTKGRPIHALAVGGWIFAAHWFTSSMSQANPALTIARAFTTSPSGVRLVDVPQLVAGQLLGVVVGLALRRIFFRAPPQPK